MDRKRPQEGKGVQGHTGYLPQNWSQILSSSLLVTCSVIKAGPHDSSLTSREAVGPCSSNTVFLTQTQSLAEISIRDQE